MRIAVAQTAIKFEDKEHNRKKIREMMSRAAENQAQLIVFPEMSFTGFSMNTHVTQELDSKWAHDIISWAQFQGIAAAFGWVKAGFGRAENHYSMIDAQGLEQADYIKIHPFSYAGEDQYFAAGNSVSIGTVNGYRIGIFICYDLRFPEIFQAVSGETDIIVVAANWPAVRSEQWSALLKARAIENQCYVIGVNCTGVQQDVEYEGQSCVIDPQGNVLLQMDDQEGIGYCDVKNDVEQYRNKFPVKRDRKNDLYKMLLK